MTLSEVLKELEALGTEQTRKTFRRHGAGDNLYGVKFGDLGKLKKKTKIDHDLALKLWETGNYDARNFATLIADPEEATEKMLNGWVKDMDNYGHPGLVATYTAGTAVARKLAERWVESDNEWICRTGWMTMALLAGRNELPDHYFVPYLETIEREIQTSKNYVRDAMNSALIAFGTRPGLLEDALRVAKDIGPLEVDYGDTSCKTPDATAYILKNLEYRAKKKGMAL